MESRFHGFNCLGSISQAIKLTQSCGRFIFWNMASKDLIARNPDSRGLVPWNLDSRDLIHPEPDFKDLTDDGIALVMTLFFFSSCSFPSIFIVFSLSGYVLVLSLVLFRFFNMEKTQL